MFLEFSRDTLVGFVLFFLLPVHSMGLSRRELPVEGVQG